MISRGTIEALQSSEIARLAEWFQMVPGGASLAVRLRESRAGKAAWRVQLDHR
jgi:hypothetical protein